MNTNLNQSGEQWVVTLRRASAGSTATVFPLLPGPKVCTVSAHRATGARHHQAVWTCAVPLLDVQLSVATSVELAGARSH